MSKKKKRTVNELLDEVYNATGMPKWKNPLQVVEHGNAVEIYDADGRGVAMMSKATLEKIRAFSFDRTEPPL